LLVSFVELGLLYVVFYGDSITIERWLGTSLGIPDRAAQKNLAIFQSSFEIKSGGKVEGIAMGLGGDTVSIKLLIYHWYIEK
jgi:hypothetical protein